MIWTNTGWLGTRNGLNQIPKRNLAGLGLFEDWTQDDVQKATTAVNSELLYLMNLNRINQGLPPINAANAAPTVNVGMSPEIRNMLLLGGGVLLLVMLAKRKRS